VSEPEEWISTTEAAVITGMTDSGVKKAAQRGDLVAVAPHSAENPSRRWKISARSAREYADGHRRPLMGRPVSGVPGGMSGGMSEDPEMRRLRVEVAAERVRADRLASELATERVAQRDALRSELDAALAQVQALAAGSADMAESFAATLRGIADGAAARQRHMWAEELGRPGPPEPPGT
jgi:hypothetical protein